jgi:hypothetical protein
VSGAYLFLVVLVAAAFLVIAGGKLARWRLFRGRTSVPLPQLYETEVKSLGIEYQAFERTVIAIAASYSVDVGLVRPADQLEAYRKIDTWVIGEGAEKLGRWLSDEVGRPPPYCKLSTVSDLMRLVQDAPVHQ